MTSETQKVKSKLEALTSSFDDLEALLEPLFAQSFPETLLSLEPLQQAKLHTVVPYLVYDLIFIYLKSKGIDPKTHPVVPELDRIRQYFEKINHAENPPTRRTEVDKAAASRFIKHAIAQSQWKKTPAESAQDEETTVVPAKITKKMLERAAYEKEIKKLDEDGEEEEELEVFDEGGNERTSGDGDGEDSMDVDTPHFPRSNGKGKEKMSDVAIPTITSNTTTTIKRRRPAIDPFAGYGDDPTKTTAASNKKKSKVKPSPSAAEPAPENPTTPIPKRRKQQARRGGK